MGTFEDIRPLTPTPPATPLEQRRTARKPRDKGTANHPRRRPAGSPKTPDASPPHIDEYV